VRFLLNAATALSALLGLSLGVDGILPAMAREVAPDSLTSPLAYATGARPPLSRRAWKALLWVGVAQSAVMVAVLALSARALLSLFEFLRGQPILDWYVTGLLVHHFAVPAMGLTNVLALAGYAAGMRGRSPRPWFLVYVPTQLGFMAIQYAIAIALVAGSPHQVGPNSSVGTGAVRLVQLPVAFAIVGVPLLLLLFPRIRKGCFAG